MSTKKQLPPAALRRRIEINGSPGRAISRERAAMAIAAVQAHVGPATVAAIGATGKRRRPGSRER